MRESYKQNGVLFNLKEIRKNNPDIWERYKNELIKCPNIEDMDQVYFNELTDYIDGRVVFNFLQELLPSELREELEKY
ncbi:hypothetical protein P5F75_13070 [Caldifermentibacillus hisashii]|uniref:hypothetical protein n=1 Tax=Caldifermentibacillus hisashii TaxID=996558 RepID=UPI002E24FC97|nr:hypothetical protein [Caldifermentibacillus hisashii]